MHRQMHLAPLAAALNAMHARLPFAIAQELDTGAVDEQVQGAVGSPIGDLHHQGPLASAQGRIVRHSPVQARHLQQAGYHSRRLLQRQLEQHLDRQTELDRGIKEHRRATGAALRRREQVISLSSQISKDPRLFSEAV